MKLQRQDFWSGQVVLILQWKIFQKFFFCFEICNRFDIFIIPGSNFEPKKLYYKSTKEQNKEIIMSIYYPLFKNLPYLRIKNWTKKKELKIALK